MPAATAGLEAVSPERAGSGPNPPSPHPPGPVPAAHPQAAPSRCQATALMAAAAMHDGSEEDSRRRGALWAAPGRHGGGRAAGGGMGPVGLYGCCASALAAVRGYVPAAAAPHHTAPGEGGGRDGGPHGAGRRGLCGVAGGKIAASGLGGGRPRGELVAWGGSLPAMEQCRVLCVWFAALIRGAEVLETRLGLM